MADSRIQDSEALIAVADRRPTLFSFVSRFVLLYDLNRVLSIVSAPQFAELGACGQQFIAFATGDDAAPVQHDDLVGALQGGAPMRYD
jgi:hypothetical protein